MRHPWNFDPDWEESASTYYNLTHGGPGWDDYVDTLSAYYYNSMKVPSFAGYVCRYALSISAMPSSINC